MPLGNTDPYPTIPGGAPRTVGAPQLPAGVAGIVTGPPVGAGGRPVVDLWENHTVTPTEFGPDGAFVEFGSPVERLEIEAGPGDLCYLNWRGPARNTPGSYRARNPGGGVLTIPVPAITSLWLWVGSSGVPVGNIEVSAHAGAWARVPL